MQHTVNIKEEDIVLCVIDFLEKSGHYESMRTLEKENDLVTVTLCENVQFFRGLILDGDYQSAIDFLQPLRENPDFKYNDIMFEIKKQWVIELMFDDPMAATNLETTSGKINRVIHLFKELEQLSDHESYMSLCQLMTLDSIQDSPEFKNWTKYQGRYQTYIECLPHFQIIFDEGANPKRKVESNILLEHIKASVIHHGQLFKEKTRKLPNYSTANILKLPIIFDGIEDNKPHHPTTNNEEYQNSTLLLHKQTLNTTTDKDKHLNQTINPSDMSFEAVAQVRNILQKTGLIDTPESINQSTIVNDLEKYHEEFKKGDRSDPIDTPIKIDNNLMKSQKIMNSNYQTVKELNRTANTPSKLSLAKNNNPSVPSDYTNIVDKIDSPVDRSNKQNDKTIESDSNLGQNTVPQKYLGLTNLNMKQFKPIGIYRDNNAIRCSQYHPSGDYVAIGTNSKSVRIFKTLYQVSTSIKPLSELPKLEIVYEYEKIHLGSVNNICWGKNGNVLATCSNDLTIKLINFNSFPKVIKDPKVESFEGQELSAGQELGGGIRDIQFRDNDSNFIISVGSDKQCKLWDITNTKSPIVSLGGHTDNIFTVRCFDRNQIFTASGDGTVKSWDLRTGDCISTSPLFRSAIYNLSINHNKYLYTIGMGNNHVIMFDIKQNNIIKDFNVHSDQCRSVNYSPGGEWLVSGGFDQLLALFDCNRVKHIAYYRGQTDKVLSVNWHPKIPQMISTSADSSIVLWGIPNI